MHAYARVANGMIHVILSSPAYSVLGVACAVMMIAIGWQWNIIANHLRIQNLSLADVEVRHPHLPGTLEVMSTSILSIAFSVLFVQFIATVYAATFTLSSSTVETKPTIELAVFDVDGDGDLDYVAMNTDAGLGNNFDLYKNDGNGGYATVSTFGDSNASTGIATGDIDGDGDVDVVTSASAGGAGLDLYRNDGTGVFTNTNLTAAGYNDVALADIDADGDLDIVVTNSNTQVIVVYLNNGVGGFATAPSTLPLLGTLAMADFNSDGYPDIVAITSAGAAAVLKNSGTGAFTFLAGINPVQTITAFAAGDVDGDGDIDVVITNGTSTGRFAVYYNNGLGTVFTNGSNYGDVAEATSIALGDIDNDGDLDVMLGGSDGGGQVNGGNEVWVNDGSDIFSLEDTAAQQTDCTNSVALGDIDNDGDLDNIAGNTAVAACDSSGGVNRHYKNDQAATIVNGAPSAPSTGFGATLALNNLILTLHSTNSVGTYASMKIPSDGLPVIAYYDFTNGNLQVIKCDAVNCSGINTSTPVDSGGNVGANSALAISADGFPVISYYDDTNNDLKVLKCTNADCSSSSSVTVDSTGDVGSNTSIFVPADGFPVIAYYDNDNTRLKVAKCGNAACSAGNTVTTVGDADTGVSTTSITVPTSDGLPLITYHHTSSDALKAIKCGNASCTAGNTISTVDSSNGAGDYSSVAIGTDGLPIISYYYSSSTDLGAIQCANASCSATYSPSTVDSVGSVGTFTSIVVPSDGFPRISYYDAANGNLKIVQCGGSACGGGNTITALDTTGNIGLHTSIAVDANGIPAIAYYDSGNADLKFIKCGNASCTSGGSDGQLHIRLSWGSGSDGISALRQLQYQLRVGTGSMAHNIMPSHIGSPNYTTRLLPNGQSRTILLSNQPCNATYYWGVKTVDSGFRLSAESTEQSFSVNSSCIIASSSPPPPPAAGGGTLWRMSRATTGGGSAEAAKNLSGRLFIDLNGDGEKSIGERWLISKDIMITAMSGGSGNASEESAMLTASLAAEDPRKKTGETKSDAGGGYALVMPAGTHELSVALPGMEMTIPVTVNVTEGESVVANIPVRWNTLVRHQPCLTVAGKGGENDASALELLKLLQDSFSKPIVVPDEQGLMQREDVVPLLAKTQCTSMPKSAAVVRGLMQQKKLKAFADLPLSDAGKVLQTYGLALSGVGVGKTDRVYDGLGYVTRAQMVTMVAGAMDLGAWSREHREMLLGVDVPKDAGAVADDVRALMALDVLPSSMRDTFAGDRGVTWGEGALMLARAAFAAGRIDLRTEKVVVEKSFSDLKLGVCWTVDADRARNVVVRDTLPGSPLADDAELLLRLGAKRGSQTAWLIPGSSWMTDLGVTRGSTVLRAEAPVSVVEMLRELLVFSCLPPPGRAEVIKAMAEGEKVESGSAGQLLKQDLIAGIKESASFVSRVLLTAQRPMRLGNLSPVFSFTDVLVGGEGKRDVSGPVSVEEGSQMVASTVLGMLVKQEVISRVEAEDRMSALTRRVRVFLLDDREEVRAAQTTMTRGDLVRVMAAVARGALGDAEDTSIGETWRNRLSQ